MSTNPFDGIFDNLSLPDGDPAPTKSETVAKPEAPKPTPIYSGRPVVPQGVSAPPSAADVAVVSELGLSMLMQNNICVLARDLYLNDKAIDARSIKETWPRYEIGSDKETIQRAGIAPSQEIINAYLLTDAFKDRIAKLGVYLGVNSLNSKQRAFLDMLGDTSSSKALSTIKKELRISAIEYRSWLKQPVFQNLINQTGDRSLRSAIPIAKARIARKMEAGDLAFIKFGFEVTGEYNPNDRKQVDAQGLIRVIFEVLEEEIKDPEILKRIGAKVQLRGAGGSVVQGQIE